MTMREKIVKIICLEKYCGQCDTNLEEEIDPKTIDAILSAIEESLPKEKELGSRDDDGEYFFNKGSNSCLFQIKAILKKK